MIIGYFKVNGPDCWEHEPNELLQKDEVAFPLIFVEIAETLSASLKGQFMKSLFFSPGGYELNYNFKINL